MTHSSRRTPTVLITCLIFAATLFFFTTHQEQDAAEKRSVHQAAPMVVRAKKPASAPPRHRCSDPNCASNHTPPNITASPTSPVIAFPLVMPGALSNKTARVGDVVGLSIGAQAFSIELTTAAYMQTGFLFEGTIGDDGIFMLGEYEGIRQGALVPSASQGEIAYTLEGSNDDAEWIEKPISEV